MNALKHGLCASPTLSPVLPGESEATFETIRQELRDEFHPRTAMESWIVEKIAQQLWRLMRAAEVERRLVALEERNLARAMADGAEDLPDDGTLPPAGELLARVLSAGESHPMMLLARYERGMQSMVLRLLARLGALQKRANDSLYGRAEKEAFQKARDEWNDPPRRPPPPRPPPRQPAPPSESESQSQSQPSPSVAQSSQSVPSQPQPAQSSQSQAPSPRVPSVSPPIPLTIKTKPPEATANGAKPAIPNRPEGSKPHASESARRNEPTAAPAPQPVATSSGAGSSDVGAAPRPPVQSVKSVVQSGRSTDVGGSVISEYRANRTNRAARAGKKP